MTILQQREPILECRGLYHAYGKEPSLLGVDLKVEAGGIVGLLGPNGSGKTTLIKLIMGMLQPSQGEVLIDGKSPCPETRAETAYLPDANYLCEYMTVAQQLDYFVDFFKDFDRDRAAGMLSRLGISSKQRIRALSKGNKEKLGLVLTMSRRAKLFVLDEPIAGVDPAARDFILDTILSNKPEDSTIFLCTHLISDIEETLTHAVFLDRGKVVMSGRADELRQREGKSLNDLFREVFRW